MNLNYIVSKDLCTGCGVCGVHCPNKAISVECDNRGFRKYVIDDNKCTDCGLCIKSCHIVNEYRKKEPITVYGAHNKNVNVLMSSQSGGVFYTLAKKVLEDGGVVYGAAFDDSLNVNHVEVRTIDELKKLQGSKYVQSSFENILKRIINNNKNGIKQLVSGTPCQIASIKRLVNIFNLNEEIIITIDIICHGTPSTKVFEDFKDYMSKDDKMLFFNFRDKEIGWRCDIETSYLVKQGRVRTSIYTKLFYSHLALTDNCFSCKYKNLYRPSDITLGDFWGVEKYYRDNYNSLGNSLVLINSMKGANLFGLIKEQLLYFVVNDKDAFMQPCLKIQWDIPSNYKVFWDFYLTNDFSRTIKKFNILKKKSIFKKINRFIKTMLKRLARK